MHDKEMAYGQGRELHPKPKFFVTFEEYLSATFGHKNFRFCFPQSWPHQDLLSRNVLGLAMIIFPPWRQQYHHNLRLSDGLIVLAWIEIVAILVYHQPSYNTSHTMKVRYETQWPTVANRYHFVLWDVSCMESWHLLTPSLGSVHPGWSCCQQVQWFTL